MRTEQFLEGYNTGLRMAIYYLDRGATLTELKELEACEDPYYDKPEWIKNKKYRSR